MNSIIKTMIELIPPGKLTTLANWQVVIAAGIIASFSLNTMSAEIVGSPATGIQERMARMKSMTPEQRAERRKKMREHWQNMSPGERADIRAKMQEHWKNLPPEERAARRQEMRERFKKMSPEERNQFKQDMRGNPAMPTEQPAGIP